MSTQTTDLLYQQLRTALLAYADPDGNTIASVIAQRFYRQSAPDNAAFPYGVISLKSVTNPEGSKDLKIVGDCEVFFFGNPRSAQPIIEALGDRCVEWMHTYRDGSSGLAWFETAAAVTLPPFASPADRDKVQVRVLGRFHCYPVFLSRLST